MDPMVTPAARSLIAIAIALFTIVGLAGCGADTIKGKPVAADKSGPDSNEPDLGGTSWRTNESNKNVQIFLLREDGYVDYKTKTPDETEFRSYSGDEDNSTWTLTGTKLTLKINDAYATYTATVKGNKLVDGAARNVKGKNWTWTAAKQ
jgi:hypothetical protein